MEKEEFTTLEVCHRLAPIEGQKEKIKKKEEKDVLKKALPVITAIALSIVIWTLFPMWIVTVCEKKYDFMTIIVGTLVVMVFAGSTTWHSIKAYREWRKNDGKKSYLR